MASDDPTARKCRRARPSHCDCPVATADRHSRWAVLFISRWRLHGWAVSSARRQCRVHSAMRPRRGRPRHLFCCFRFSAAARPEPKVRPRWSGRARETRNSGCAAVLRHPCYPSASQARPSANSTTQQTTMAIQLRRGIPIDAETSTIRTRAKLQRPRSLSWLNKAHCSGP